MSNQRKANSDAMTAGAMASAGIADVARSVGSNAPELTGQLSEQIAVGSGFARIAGFQRLVLTTIALYSAVAGGLYWLNINDPQTSGFLGLLVVLGGVGVTLGIGLTLWFQLPQYASLKFRVRLWLVEEDLSDRQRAGCGVLGHPLADVLLIAPFYLIGVLAALPFWILGMVLEVLRTVFVPGAHYRGDQGKYYERARKQYAVQWKKYGQAQADQWLRYAYNGLLSEPGTYIPWELWGNGKYKTLLAPMIERHGPVDKYCSGTPGQPKGTVSKTIPSKYSAI